MIVTIHQPEHLPWLGFFDKVRQADVFVMLDHVQFSKHYFQNRNRIRTDRGWAWLTVPVLTKGIHQQPINTVRINNQGSPRWRDKCGTTILHHYQKACYWKDHRWFFEDLYTREWELLVDLNEAGIRYLLEALGIKVTIVKSSALHVTQEKGDLILDICKKLGAATYLSGVSGRDYLNPERFAEQGIRLEFQEFHHPVYRQLHEPFQPCMSAIDLLLNYGPASLDVIKGVGVETMASVFQ